MFHGIVVFVPLYLFFVQFSNTVLLQSKFVMLWLLADSWLFWFMAYNALMKTILNPYGRN